MVAAFGKDDQTEICKLILDKGELQVSGKERQEQLDASVKDVANTIAGELFNYKKVIIGEQLYYFYAIYCYYLTRALC